MIIKTLLLEDNAGDARLVELLLSESSTTEFKFVHAPTLVAGLAKLEAGLFDVILLDMNLPDGRGLELVHAIQQCNENVPIVIFTGQENDELALQALRQGAQDYLVKNSLNQDALIRAIHYSIQRKKLETELMAAQKDAEQANKAKSFFLASMSHEIRTPLNGVLGMMGLLQQSKLQPDQKEYIDLAQKSGKHLLEVINNILDFSKIEAGKFDREMLEFNLRSCLEEITDLHGLTAFQKGLELVLDISPDVPTLLIGDYGHLRLILINLMSNAIKFTKQGEVKLEITKISESENKAQLKFSVCDTGPGIGEEEQNKLFEPFDQIRCSTSRYHGGSGLGLTICKKLAETLGSQITVTSKVGQGSCFSFSAFFETMEQPNEDLWRLPDEIAGLRVLVAEDNESARKVLVRKLNSFGCRVTTADNAKSIFREYAKSLAQDPIRIIFSSVKFGDTDAKHLHSQLKAEMKRHGSSFVLLSPMGQNANRDVFHRDQFDDYVVKPVKRAFLYNAILKANGLRKIEDDFRNRPLIDDSHNLEKIPKGSRILLVDDNPINQQVGRHLLENIGLYCEIASDGREAIHAIDRQHFDLILMDCVMPILDGYATTRLIRNKEPEGKRTPIIAMSAATSPIDREKCRESGMDDFIAKPVEPGMLYEVLGKFLVINQHRPFEEEETGDGPPEYPFVDETILQKSTLGDLEFSKRITEAFLSTARDRVDSVGNAVARGNFTEARKILHTLKGSSGQLGALALSHCSQDLMNLLDIGDKAGLKKKLPDLRLCFEATATCFLEKANK